MACPITVCKFAGTVSLGLLTGLSYSTSHITIPALKLLPTSTAASRCFNEVKRLNRKYALRLSGIVNSCFLFAFYASPPWRQHPYMMWACTISSAATWGLDYYVNRHRGLKTWLVEVIRDGYGVSLTNTTSRKEEDLVVVDTESEEEDVNGESVQAEMANESTMQIFRLSLSYVALSIAIVGLWGDKKPSLRF
ncbi:hypothetical protein N7532_007883 [Penicillium argentinense]|uniref:Uncharacterized protein n=1 Tax=Penicillium argentinense TaxID=1131581 RepID=A0A9W9EWI8_9EURO|nr:uncharacterized protein N7532_007883 [Penicillium argentinense]KAJ5089199.1 hypothetical protein N7532_007883 [Penicillium argentinense]